MRRSMWTKRVKQCAVVATVGILGFSTVSSAAAAEATVAEVSRSAVSAHAIVEEEGSSPAIVAYSVAWYCPLLWYYTGCKKW